MWYVQYCSSPFSPFSITHRRIFRLHHQLGTIYGTECAIDNMSITNGHKGGIIMNISSVAGLKPTQHMPVYGASKHAIIGYTKSLGAFSAPTGIKFLVVCPGITVTAMSKTMGDHFYRTDILPVDVDRYVNLLPRQR